jgi:NET1-associated nuclear protein 1 (U3 small nucleolar RNA-associated protein 17)
MLIILSDLPFLSYLLHTRVDMPHDGRVRMVFFSPDTKNPLAITVGRDGKFKFWELLKVQDTSNKTSSTWNCRSVGFFRDYPCRSAAFSTDGSVLAVSYGHIITLWDPLTNILRRTLSQSMPDETIGSVAFVTSSPHLIASTRQSLYVWDLIECEILWKIRLSAQLLMTDPGSSCFAVLSKGG